MQKKSILKILGENDKNIKLRKMWGVVLVEAKRFNSMETLLCSKQNVYLHIERVKEFII